MLDNDRVGPAKQPLSAQEIQKVLGIEPGTVLPELVRLAFKSNPAAPALAFEDLWFILPWLGGKTSIEELRAMGTPTDVLPFATTGGDFGQYGFLMDGDIPTDKRPIVFVMPNDESVTDIIAPDIRAFLGLIASGPVDRILRAWSDDDWVTQAKEFGGQGLLGSRRRLAGILCSIPGVSRPSSPSSLTRAVPSRPFKTFPGVEVEMPPELAEMLQRAKEKAEKPEPSWLAHRLSIDLSEALREKRFREAAERAEGALDNKHGRARLLAVAARARWSLGQREEGRKHLQTLLMEWLDNQPLAPPFPHPRSSIEPTELLDLIRLLELSNDRDVVQKVTAAGPAPEHADFF